MTGTFTLAHLSDVHLAPIAGFRLRYWNTKRALGFLNWQRGRRRVHVREVADRIAADVLAHEPDHIAVTGDLANLGLPGEYENAAAWLAQLGDPQRVSVVPGNHDIYSGRLGDDTCLKAWAPYMRNSESWTDDAPVQFPYVRTEGPVALIGLNSAVPTPPFVAAGRLGQGQLDQFALSLERLAAAGYIRVVMIHHPPLPGQARPRRALQDAAAFASVLDRHGAELVLHGHNHRQTLAWHRHSGGRIPVLGVASASAGRLHKNEPLARYHLIRLWREDGVLHITCETRGLTSPEGDVTTIETAELMAAPVA